MKNKNIINQYKTKKENIARKITGHTIYKTETWIIDLPISINYPISHLNRLILTKTHHYSRFELKTNDKEIKNALNALNSTKKQNKIIEKVRRLGNVRLEHINESDNHFTTSNTTTIIETSIPEEIEEKINILEKIGKLSSETSSLIKDKFCPNTLFKQKKDLDFHDVIVKAKNRF